jgi:hypothetical protein
MQTLPCKLMQVWRAQTSVFERCPAEYVFCRRVAEDSIKNYQLWNHRRKIALAMGAAATEQELRFCAGEVSHVMLNLPAASCCCAVLRH